MITFNTDYNDNTDHELTIEQLEAVAGGGIEDGVLRLAELPFGPIIQVVNEVSKL